VTKTYDISHAPVLLEQLEYLITRKEELLASVTKEYGTFLTFINERGEQDKDSVGFNHLQDIYAFSADRLSAISQQLTHDIEDLEELIGIVENLHESNDAEQWSELTQELFEEGEYTENADDFIASVDREIEVINKDLEEMMLDWKSSIIEGREDELALLLQAYADEIEQEEDEFSFLPESKDDSKSSDGCCDNGKSCKSDNDDDDDACCGGGCC